MQSASLFARDRFLSWIRRPILLAIAAMLAPSGLLQAADPGYAWTNFAGLGRFSHTDGTGSAARFFQPGGVAIDGSGTLYVADTPNSTIRKVTSDGIVTTFAGSPQVDGTMDGPASSARFTIPGG